MSDSNNIQTTAQKTAAPVAEQSAKPKSWTERFLDVEADIEKLVFTINFQARAIRSMLNQQEAMAKELDNLRLVKQTVNAMLKLSDEGVTLTTTNVLERIIKMEQDQSKNRLKKDLENGILVSTDKVEKAEDLVEFTSADIQYGLSALDSFTEEVQAKMKAASVGDVVEGMTLLGLYKEKPQAEGAASQQ